MGRTAATSASVSRLPINRAKLMLEDYRAGKSFGRAWLGVSTVYIAGDLAEALKLPASGGLLIQEVRRGTAADQADLRGYRDWVRVGNQRLGVGGDFITAIDGKPVTEPDAITRASSRKRPGDVMDLTVYRNGRSMNVKVKLGEAPERCRSAKRAHRVPSRHPNRGRRPATPPNIAARGRATTGHAVRGGRAQGAGGIFRFRLAAGVSGRDSAVVGPSRLLRLFHHRVVFRRADRGSGGIGVDLAAIARAHAESAGRWRSRADCRRPRSCISRLFRRRFRRGGAWPGWR